MQVGTACDGDSGALSFHAYLDVWIHDAEVAIHTMVGPALAAMQSSAVSAYNSSISSLRDVHAVIVKHHAVASPGAGEADPTDAAEVLASDVS